MIIRKRSIVEMISKEQYYTNCNENRERREEKNKKIIKIVKIKDSFTHSTADKSTRGLFGLMKNQWFLMMMVVVVESSTLYY
jgi:hypothetical protein